MINRFRLQASSWSQTVLRILFVFLMVFVTGCGVLGGGDDDNEDKKYPEPPGRPGAAVAVVEVQPAPALFGKLTSLEGRLR